MAKITIVRMTKLQGDGAKKAFCDIDINGVIQISGVSLVDGSKGMFAGMPSRQGKDGKWWPIVKVKDEALASAITQAVSDHFFAQEANAGGSENGNGNPFAKNRVGNPDAEPAFD